MRCHVITIGATGTSSENAPVCVAAVAALLNNSCTPCWTGPQRRSSDPGLRESPLRQIEIIMKVCLEVCVGADFISRSRSSARRERVVLVSYSLSRLSDSLAPQGFNISLCSCSMKVNRKMSPNI